jgi:hypothetical protein
MALNVFFLVPTWQGGNITEKALTNPRLEYNQDGTIKHNSDGDYSVRYDYEDVTTGYRAGNIAAGIPSVLLLLCGIGISIYGLISPNLEKYPFFKNITTKVKSVPGVPLIIAGAIMTILPGIPTLVDYCGLALIVWGVVKQKAANQKHGIRLIIAGVIVTILPRLIIGLFGLSFSVYDNESFANFVNVLSSIGFYGGTVLIVCGVVMMFLATRTTSNGNT